LKQQLYQQQAAQTMSSSSSLFQSIGTWVGHNLLYSETLASDQRTPCLTFTTSIIGNHHQVGQTTYGLLAPSLQFWLALGNVLILGAIYGTILSCVMYQFIILPRKRQKKKYHQHNHHHQHHPSSTSLLIGFGIIIPLCVIYPYYGIHYFLIKNKVVKFFFGLASLTTGFRCSESIFDFLPHHVEDSLWNFIVYNAFPTECKFDTNGPIKSNWGSVVYYIWNFIMSMCVLGMYVSFLATFDYQLYPNEEGPELLDISILNIFSWRQLANNFSIASKY
jgi:hypothetical protein